MGRRPYFWFTLAVWTLLSGAASAWAWILGGMATPWTEVGRMKGRHNGLEVEVVLRECPRGESGLPDRTFRSLRDEGWETVPTTPVWRGLLSHPAGPAGVLAGRLEPLLGLRVFRKDAQYRVVGHFKPEGRKTYLLEARVPVGALSSGPKTAQGPCGATAPDEVLDVAVTDTEGFTVHRWITRKAHRDDGWFLGWCGRQGFTVRPGRTRGPSRDYQVRTHDGSWVVGCYDGAGETTVVWTGMQTHARSDR